MEKSNKVSDVQKAAQKKYDQKTKMISVKYTPTDMDEYIKLKEYLNITGDSANALIKALINSFLTSKDKGLVANSSGNRARDKRDEACLYYPYQEIKQENVQYLYRNFIRSEIDILLEAYRQRIEHVTVCDYANKFNDFVEHRVKILVEKETKLSGEGKVLELYRLFNIRFPMY